MAESKGPKVVIKKYANRRLYNTAKSSYVTLDDLAKMVRSGEDFTVFGDGKQTRSFCYASDLIDGIVRLAASNVSDPVNIGNPREMTVLEFAEAVRTAAGGGGQILFKPMPKDDPKQRRPDITRARELLGWEPRVSLEDGLRETIAYFRKVVR